MAEQLLAATTRVQTGSLGTKLLVQIHKHLQDVFGSSSTVDDRVRLANSILGQIRLFIVLKYAKISRSLSKPRTAFWPATGSALNHLRPNASGKPHQILAGFFIAQFLPGTYYVSGTVRSAGLINHLLAVEISKNQPVTMQQAVNMAIKLATEMGAYAASYAELNTDGGVKTELPTYLITDEANPFAGIPNPAGGSRPYVPSRRRRRSVLKLNDIEDL